MLLRPAPVVFTPACLVLRGSHDATLGDRIYNRLEVLDNTDISKDATWRAVDVMGIAANDWAMDTRTDGRVRNRALNILRSTTGQTLVASAELLGDGSAEDQARWARARRAWADWWTAHGQEFTLGNPYR